MANFLHVKEVIQGCSDLYRIDIVDLLYDEFGVEVSELTVSRMLKKEWISRKKVYSNHLLTLSL